MTHCRQVEHRLRKHTHIHIQREETSNASRHSFVFALLDAKGAQVELLPSPVRGEWANKSAGTGQTRRPENYLYFRLFMGSAATCRPKKQQRQPKSLE